MNTQESQRRAWQDLEKVLTLFATPTSTIIEDPQVTDLGKNPPPNTSEAIAFALARRKQL